MSCCLVSFGIRPKWNAAHLTACSPGTQMRNVGSVWVELTHVAQGGRNKGRTSIQRIGITADPIDPAEALSDVLDGRGCQPVLSRVEAAAG
jgi:hypothetical protein